MAADISRHRFDPARDYAGVVMQQGRVQLDADWNEQVLLLDRRLRAETTDVIGRAVVPVETKDAFQIKIAGTGLTIGPGRMYVHGLLAENHGARPFRFDGVLAETRGDGPVTYAQQPYLPNPPALSVDVTHLVYLDVWQREVTEVEEPALVEPAVGVDTTARLQTVWQVKTLPVDAATTCATPADSIPAWVALTKPAGGRLTTVTLDPQPQTDPCLIPPSGRYRGLDNRTYRVEIHAGDDGTPATFKWSRDNGSVVTPVLTVNAARDTLGVVRTGRDEYLGFAVGDWVEVTDNALELAGKPGEVRRVLDVNAADRTVKLSAALAAGLFPVGPQDKLDPARRTRLRRWDQSGLVRDTDGNTLINLDTSTAGVIPVPAATKTVVLEDGIAVRFGLDPAGRGFRPGDHWIFTARTATADAEQLVDAPPVGVHHHYARLAVVKFPGTALDCRTFWPPPAAAGKSCDCTVCVSVADHNSGSLTIQAAIDKVISLGGGKVCLEAGVYALGRDTLTVTGGRSVRLTGKGRETVLLSSSLSAAVLVSGSQDVVLEEFTLSFPPGKGTQLPEAGTVFGLVLFNSERVRVHGCAFRQLDATPRGVGVALAGRLTDVTLRDNAFAATVGLANLDVPATNLMAAKPTAVLCQVLAVENNEFFCPEAGVRLDGRVNFLTDNRITGNAFLDARQTDAGIIAVGSIVNAGGADFGRVLIAGNEIYTSGDGIRVGLSRAVVRDNRVTGVRNADGLSGRGSGIVLVPALDPARPHVTVVGNTVAGSGRHGIVIAAAVQDGLIARNRVEGANGSGIVMTGAAEAGVLSVTDNHIADVGRRPDDLASPFAGVLLFRVGHADVAGNSVRGVGLPGPGRGHFGVYLLACTAAAVSRNELLDVGPGGEFETPKVGIQVDGTFEHVELVDNVVRRSPPSEGTKPVLAASIVVRAGGAKASFADIAFNVDKTGLVGTYDSQPFAVPLGREHVAIRGNRLDAFPLLEGIAVAAVRVECRGPCVLTDNHVRREVL